MVVGTCVMSVIRRNIGRQHALQGSWTGGFCKINIHDVTYNLRHNYFYNLYDS